jgi:hypothetical protein
MQRGTDPGRVPVSIVIDLMLIDLIQAHGTTAMQNVLELIVVDAHAASGLLKGQTFADDQAHGRPIQCSLASFVVAHDCRSGVEERI